jgi:hypothetical protein
MGNRSRFIAGYTGALNGKIDLALFLYSLSKPINHEIK